MLYGLNWSGGGCLRPGPVSPRPARGGGRWRGCPPTPCAGRWSAAGPLGRVSAACCPPGSGPAADPEREAADEPDVLSAAGWFVGVRVKRGLSLSLGWRENGGDMRPFGAGPGGPGSGIGGK